MRDKTRASDVSKVPVIDLGALDPARPDRDALRELDTACRDHGFFLLTGHGMHALIEAVWRQTRVFFALPRERKRGVERSRDNALGYFDRELTKRKRDRKEVFDYADDAHDIANAGFGRSRWPQGLPGFRDNLIAYSRGCAALTNQVLAALYTALGLSPAEVPVAVGAEHTAFVRLNHYPVEDPVAQDERHDAAQLGDMALHHHTDPGVITLLLQDDVGGLQTRSRDAGWIDVPPHPDTIVVNMSDMLQVLTNDNYRASLHRVLPVPGRDRYSIVYFSMPRHDALIEPAPALYEGAAGYRSFTWTEFISGRLGDNFADYGVDDIQIADYRTGP